MGEMPCGTCAVCDDELDHSRLGVCARCGQGFHWGECGGWEQGQHVCDNCSEDEDE